MASFSLNCSLNLLLSSESLVSYVKGSQAGAPVGTWKQAPKLRTACLAPFHTQLMPTCPGMVSHSGYGPPTSIISQEKYPTATPHSHAPQPIWWKWFLNWESLSPNYYSSCQVAIKLTNTYTEINTHTPSQTDRHTTDTHTTLHIQTGRHIHKQTHRDSNKHTSTSTLFNYAA